MFENLERINARPAPFEVYTAAALWTDAYRSEQMLAFHLNKDIDVSSRNVAFINSSASWMISQFRLGPDSAVCDFGCGPGLYTSRLAASGAQVTGLDFSENSLRYARDQAAQSGHAITYIQTDYLAYQPDTQFDLITMIMCDFCALSPVQRNDLLKKFHGCLKAGGAILLDVYSMSAFAEREDACFYEKNQLNQFWYADDYYCFVNTFKYDDAAVVLDKYSLFPKSGSPETVYNWLEYFSPDSLKAELEAAGFAVQHIYNDVSGTPYSDQNPEFAVIAVKSA